jgi:hypothetical protein
MKRNFGYLKKLKKQEDALEAAKLVPEVDREAIFKVPTKLKYADLPKDAGPPYPRAKPARPALQSLRKG